MKKRFLGITGVLVVLLSLMFLAGCVTTMLNAISRQAEVETETSLSIKKAATDALLSKEDGITPNILQAELERQFPGINFGIGSSAFSIDFSREKDTDFTYGDKKYRIRYFGDSSTNKVTRIVSCVELQKKEKEETP
jgi:Na+-transporting methylmalonyl-CoA/oxaloacetate decarboxylase gamma subunit